MTTNNNDWLDIVPANFDGKQVNIEETFTATHEEAAKELFASAKCKLLQPHTWQQADEAAVFQLIKKHKSGSDTVEEGDYLKISLPAPGNKTGDGFDWVTVEAVSNQTDSDADESFGLRLRAADNPEIAANDTAHFFDENATSTFTIRRNMNLVTASYHGRNEKPNTASEKFGDKIRNTLVAIGAMAGFSEAHWKKMVKWLLC
jgi:hypothetical protein